MTKILSNVVASQRCTATATDGVYNYNVSYEIGDNGKTLNSVNVSVNAKDSNAYAGNMSYQNTSKNVSAPDTVDTKVLLTMLDAIIAEIKAGLVIE